jgi:fructose-bisphosphate aldolase class II
MNIDTDLQFAFTEGIRDYMLKNIEYLKLKLETQKVPMFLIKTLRSKKMVAWKWNHFQYKIEQAFADLNNVNTL